jgi:DNA-binding CsgD family transcriptional regulator/tetratricopeptide (TPR) repeat protein
MLALRRALDGLTEARGGVVVLVGAAGIGKTRLAQWVATDAHGREMVVLQGRAVAAPTPAAYRALAEALCSAVRTGHAPRPESLPAFRTPLSRLIPEWRTSDAPHVDDSVVAIAEAVVRFLRALAGNRGCLVVLEDLHWADPETLTIVEYLADNLTSERVLCIATVRDDDRSPALDLAHTLDARRASQLVDLGRLGDDDVATMVASCLNATVAPDAVLDLAARADGVPFLVEELLAVAVSSGALIDEGTSWVISTSAAPVVPLTFADSIRRRLNALGNETRSVLYAAAVLGRAFNWDLLPAMTALDEPTVFASLRAAVDAQIVSVESDQTEFRFRHALSRDAVLAELLPPERGILSRRALEAIDARHPDLAGHWSELAAELAAAAGDRVRAATLLLDIGRRARDDGALVTAEATLERALALTPDTEPIAADLEECLVDVLSLVGKRDRAVEVGDSLLARLGADGNAASRRAETFLRLARASVAATRWDEARARLDEARTQASDVDDECLLARVDALDALVALGDDDQDRAAERARAALAAAERAGPPEVACEALMVLGRVERWRDLSAAERAFRRAVRIAEEHGLTVWRMRALHELGTIDMLGAGRAELLEEARALAVSVGDLATAAVLDVQICGVLIARDDPEPALAVARRAAHVARRHNLGQTLAVALGFEAVAYARAGQKDAMEECLAEARLHAAGDASIDVFAALARSFLALIDEDQTRALQHLEDVGEMRYRTNNPLLGVWALLTALDADKGEAAVATIRARGEPFHYLARGWFRYAEAVVFGRAGRTGDAFAGVDAGDRLLMDFGWYRHYGHRLVAEAALTDGWGDPVAWLREALAFFATTGHARSASACRSLLRRAGAPVPRRGRGTAEVPAQLRALGVTSREVDVLGLVADGLTNREIADRLFLSPRTVENHVERLLSKTGASNRRELARVLTGGS